MYSPFKSLIILAVVPCMIAATMPVGSITSSGDSTVSGVSVPSGTAVFPGDVISTSRSGATLNLAQGGTIQLGVDSQVRINQQKDVVIVKGLSRVQSKSHELVLLASDWRLQAQPDSKSGQFAADILRQNDGQVSLNVSSGDVLARSNHGNVTLMAQVGRPLMLPAAMPEPTPDPQGGSGSGSGKSTSSGGSGNNKGLIIGAFVVGAAAIAIGAAAIAKDPSDNSSTVASLNSTVSTLTTQITSLNSQIATITASLKSVASASQSIQNLTTSLNSQLATLNAAQAALAADQVVINGIVAKLAAGQTLTVSDQASLSAAQADVVKQSAVISSSSAAATNLINQIKSITIPSPSAPPV